MLRLNSAPQGVFSPTETLKAENESLLDQIEARELLMAQEISRRDEQLEKLNQTLAFISQERDKEVVTKRSLQKMIEILKQEQRESLQLLNQTLTQTLPQNEPLPLQTPLSKLSLPIYQEGEQVKPASEEDRYHTVSGEKTNWTEAAENDLSDQQKQLLSQRKFIGDNAWALLDGTNPSLFQALLTAIQGNPGKTVEIRCLGVNNFIFLVNQKEQNYPYKY